jgi:hypothetical protein
MGTVGNGMAEAAKNDHYKRLRAVTGSATLGGIFRIMPAS